MPRNAVPKCVPSVSPQMRLLLDFFTYDFDQPLEGSTRDDLAMQRIIEADQQGIELVEQYRKNPNDPHCIFEPDCGPIPGTQVYWCDNPNLTSWYFLKTSDGKWQHLTLLEVAYIAPQAFTPGGTRAT